MGYPQVRNIVLAAYGRWYYSDNQASGGQFQFQASPERPYTATCRKRVRR